ncbi:signal recognition particle-docking protein FtsY [Megasphaera coli]|uniref:signal recognition particle-docking protein FtsY n=1 Tax=Colibacter massiliensis TaxID=1852379 RepID=UPI00094ED808|nr:signal recognition particle-docking protein FtsY [Colibacter massiliensis]
MGFFSKLKKSLEKTKGSLFKNIEDVVRSYARIDEEMYEDLEAVMLTGDMGMEMTEYLLSQIRTGVKSREIKDGRDVIPYLEKVIIQILKENDVEAPEREGTEVIFIVGVNGVGKTTTIGKLAKYYTDHGKSVMIAAGDTFRAAASDQLTVWAERAGVPIVKHREGADAAAVVFDATTSAKARHMDVLLVDTAGRLHTKSNLMEELRKMARIAGKNIEGAPHETLLVLDATTGQNAVNQAKLFGEVVPLTGVVLTKLDGTAKGGIVLSVKRVLGVPVRWVGVGEGADDLRPFDAAQFADALFDKAGTAANGEDGSGERKEDT